MSKEDMVKEAVEEAKAKAAKEQAEAEETVETEDAQGVEAEAKEATEEATETEGDSEAASEGKKKFFGKKEKKDKKDQSYTMFSAFSTEKVADGFEYQWVRFFCFNRQREEWLQPGVKIDAKGEMGLTVHNGKPNVSCRVEELTQCVADSSNSNQ